MITAIVKNSTKPSYNCRMMFPIYFPVHNDKIIIRLWDKRKLLVDLFIAQVPEFPSQNDPFNINYL